MREDAKLRVIVAKLGNLDADQINATTPLSGRLSGSLGRARLDAAIREQLSVSNPKIYSVATYGELCEAVGLDSGSSSATGFPMTRTSSDSIPIGPTNRARIGIDVESIARFPETSDYWEDDFYKQTFTSQEIAYASMQRAPRESFAAIWCAKEALRKAHEGLAYVDWNRLEVFHDIYGRPNMLIDGKEIGGGLSLSHTNDLAIAVFVHERSTQQPPPPPSDTHPSAVAPPELSSRRRFEVFAAVTFLMSILSLILVLLRR